MTYPFQQSLRYGCLLMTRPFTWQSPAWKMLKFCHLNKWELEWDTEFNPGKCIVIHVTRSRAPIPSKYLLHGQVLESVAGSKYLGVEISRNLSFNNHIQSITTSASLSFGFLMRNIRTQNLALREMAYKALVRPVVEYSSTIWSSYTVRNIDPT